MDSRAYSVFFAVVLFSGFVSGAPMLVHGGAYVSGSPLPSGSVVYARIADEGIANFTVEEDGSFGVLLRTNRSQYSPVEFYCSGLKAKQIVPYESYSVLEIDLDFESQLTSTAVSTTSTTAYEPADIIGNVIAIKVNDNVMNLGIFVLLVVIVYSIKDLLSN